MPFDFWKDGIQLWKNGSLLHAARKSTGGVLGAQGRCWSLHWFCSLAPPRSWWGRTGFTIAALGPSMPRSPEALNTSSLAKLQANLIREFLKPFGVVVFGGRNMAIFCQILIIAPNHGAFGYNSFKNTFIGERTRSLSRLKRLSWSNSISEIPASRWFINKMGLQSHLHAKYSRSMKADRAAVCRKKPHQF